jgi:hypothetical protein
MSRSIFFFFYITIIIIITLNPTEISATLLPNSRSKHTIISFVKTDLRSFDDEGDGDDDNDNDDYRDLQACSI